MTGDVSEEVPLRQSLLLPTIKNLDLTLNERRRHQKDLSKGMTYAIMFRRIILSLVLGIKRQWRSHKRLLGQCKI